jgi:hypothetical protein
MTAIQQLKVNIGGYTETEPGTFTASFDSRTFVGYGKLTIPYDSDRWNTWNNASEEVTIWGGAVTQKTIFNGTVRYPIKEEKYITVELVDYGVNFQNLYAGRYIKQTLQDVLASLCTNCGYILDPSAVPPSILEQIITRSESIEYGQTNPSGGTIGNMPMIICGSFLPDSTNTSLSTYDSDQYYVTCVKDYCPYCDAYNFITVDTTVNSNQYLCNNCTSTYDGITGQQTNFGKSAHLIMEHEPDPKAILAPSSTCSVVNSTYENEIRSICNNNNLYMYLTQDGYAVLKEHNGTPLQDVVIEPNTIKYKSYQYIKTANQSLRPVTVNYNDGSLTVGQGDNTTERLVLTHLELDQQMATELAQRTMQAQYNDLILDTYITMIYDPMCIPGRWVKLPDPHDPQNTALSQVLRIDSVNVHIESKKVQKATLKLQST